jgi:hypothetical protein
MLGFAPALLIHLKTLMGSNYAGYKITPAGFVKTLVKNAPSLSITSVDGRSLPSNGIKLSTSGGQVREVKYKYLSPITPSQVAKEDNCDNDASFIYQEGSLTAPMFSKLSFILEWDFVERYTAEAAQIQNVGVPSTPVLNELLEQIMHTARGIVGAMDSNLLNAVVWGTNVTTGNNAAKPININKSGDVLDLSNGLIEILSDAAENEVVGEPILVGSGLMNKLAISKAALTANGAGLNLAALNGYEWAHDIQAATVWGANQVGSFARGTVGLVDIDRYVAWKTGRFGTSDFLQISLPVESGVMGEVVMMPFNVQIKMLDCPTEMFDGYTTRVVDRGYQVIISKAYGLFQPPTTIFQATDRMAGYNGALRYEVSNDCDPCEGGVAPKPVPPFANY